MYGLRYKRVLLQTLVCWTLIGLCRPGSRPFSRQERRRYSRHHDSQTQILQNIWLRDQGAQQIQYPSINDQGAQVVQYPSLQDTEQIIQFPSVFHNSQLQRCAPGFYRDRNRPYLGSCVPCECNGLAYECEDWTGRCLNCQYNTAGDRCERCKEGYYSNPGDRTCSLCPCPFSVPSNSFAVGCRSVFGSVECFCKPGYAGVRCESCAPGYYGNPLTPGGSCRPCNCNGNSNDCDPITGVCRNALEPGDTNTDDQCRECDNCVLTLLHDLENLDDELARMKTQLGNVSVSDTSKNSLAKLEKAIAEAKILVEKYSSTINTQRSKVGQLEQDTDNLSDDISSLNNKVDERAAEVEKELENVEKTHRRAKDLNTEIQNLLKNIRDLLRQLQDQSGRGDSLPSDSVTKMLADAQRMVKEMEDRNFSPQATAAKKEKEEAEKLLDFIKTNVSRLCDQNEAAAETIRGLLKDYNAKLKALNETLRNASDLVNKANTQNDLNAKRLKDLQKRIKDLENERKAVEDQMTLANNELQNTEDLMKMLLDSKADFEKLSAELDGAKAGLTVKVDEITKAAAKKDIVEAAEEHARNLTQLAKDLVDAVKNASGRTEVLDAKNAIEAYKNITDAINAAEAAANEAKVAADTALDNVNNQNLTQKSKELKDKGDALLKSAQDSEKDLQDTAKDLSQLKSRLEKAENKKKALEKDLLDVQSQLNATKTDDVRQMIEDAKTKAASANNSATNTMDRLNDIKQQIDKIQISPTNANLSNALNDADQSVKNLLNTIPSLTQKISEVENLTSQIPQVNNISESIKNIKELIEQARDAANRVAVPMMFTGDSHAELRPPQNLDDLRAFIALSLSLQRPISRGDGARRRRQLPGGLFVLYLGNRDSSKNYIGLVLRSNILYGLYKLNGVEYEIQSHSITTSDAEQSMFDQVDFRRIYQDAEVILTRKISSNKPDGPFLNSKQGQESKDLMDLSPSDVVFYVGGYPANFNPPASMRYPNYTGCIEFFSFNDKILGLYNFQSVENVNKLSPCKRYLPPVDSDFYEGTGYGTVLIDQGVSTIFRGGMSVRTYAKNGLLFFIEGQDEYLFLTIENGAIFLYGSQLKQSPVGLQDNKKIFPAPNGIEIALIMTTSGVLRLSVGSDQIQLSGTPYNLKDFKVFYLGGLTQDLRDKFNITIRPFKGCVKNLKLNSVFQSLTESVGISKGCPIDSLISRKAQFSLGSSLSTSVTGITLGNDITVSLGFKSTESQGLILQDKQLANEVGLKLENGNVILSLDGKMWKSNKQYHDGLWHYLTVTRRGGSTVLRVDDDDIGQVQPGTTSIPETGGEVVLGNGMFSGCISNFYTRRPDNLYKAEDLSSFQDSGEVKLDVCTAISPVQLMLERNAKKDSVLQVINESVAPCELPAQVHHAYRMSGPASSLTFSLPLQVLQPRPHFSLDVRTRSPEGLLFFAATRGGQSHLALYMSKGRIRLSVAKQKEIFNREKYNDGKWHSVVFSLEKKKFRLVVDGIRAQDGQLTSAELKSMQQFMPPVYLGTAPETFHKELKSKALPKQSVSGCLRNFKMNGAQMSNPTANHGAGPCFEGQTQRGVYFSGNGAHIVINDSFVVGSTLELLFNIRPRTQSALLLHVGNSSRNPDVMGHFLTVYMLRGEVVVRVNQGKGEFVVSVKPKTSLCDGNFHKISVIKMKNVIQLSVDTTDNYKIGPPSSTFTLTRDPLFVGGVPGTLHQTLPVKSPFVGCIQDMRINDVPVSFDRSSGVFGSLNLKECPG